MELNKAVLDCMRHLRRRLRDEQHLEIRLSQPDAIQAMLAACLCSSDEITRDLGKQLANYIEVSPPLVAKPSSDAATVSHQPSVRIYRGQRVLS